MSKFTVNSDFKSNLFLYHRTDSNFGESAVGVVCCFGCCYCDWCCSESCFYELCCFESPAAVVVAVALKDVDVSDDAVDALALGATAEASTIAVLCCWVCANS